MKRMLRMACLVMLVCFLMGTIAFAAGDAAKGSTQDKCPVMGGPVDKKVYLDYQGKRIYFCCSACPNEFMKDPDKYMKKMQDEGVVLEAAPKSN